MAVLRYLFYIGFVVVALAAWLIVAALFLDISMGDPACVAEGLPCPAPGPVKIAARLVIIFGGVPATALSFHFYRQAVRRMFGLDQAASSNQ